MLFYIQPSPKQGITLDLIIHVHIFSSATHQYTQGLKREREGERSSSVIQAYNLQAFPKWRVHQYTSCQMQRPTVALQSFQSSKYTLIICTQAIWLSNKSEQCFTSGMKKLLRFVLSSANSEAGLYCVDVRGQNQWRCDDVYWDGTPVSPFCVSGRFSLKVVSHKNNVASASVEGLGIMTRLHLFFF